MLKKPARKASDTKPLKRGRQAAAARPSNELAAGLEVHKLLVQPSGGNPHLASFDLNEALASNRIHCMGRSIKGHRQLTPPEFWADNELSHWLLVKRRGYGVVQSVRGWVFYVWRPDVVKASPGLLKEARRA